MQVDQKSKAKHVLWSFLLTRIPPVRKRQTLQLNMKIISGDLLVVLVGYLKGRWEHFL